MTDEIIVNVISRQYMTVKTIASVYESSPQTVRRNLQGMRDSGRYDRTKMVIDEEGKYLVDSLMYEDYLAVKKYLRDRNLARRLEPYSAEKIRKNRGDYKIPLIQAGFLEG